jgi:hypothetical protein
LKYGGVSISGMPSTIILSGENPLRCTTQDKKRPSLYFNPFLPYILIPIKIMNKKLSRTSKGLYFKLSQL